MAGWKQVLVAAACGFVSADSVRVSNKRARVARSDVSSKMIAGVPVLNYGKAYGGKPSMAESSAEEDWIMVAKKGASDEKLKALCESAGTCMRTGHPSKGGFGYFEVRGTEKDLEIILESAQGLVEFAEPDGLVQMIPEITSDANVAAASWGLDRVGAPLRASEGQNSHVFVLDTGIRQSHSDFGGRVIPTLDVTSGTATPCNGDLNCAGDVQGHGTHCAGSAAGTTFGVAPKATIHTVKVLSDSGSGSWSWSYDALDFLATSRIRPAVASMSLGGSGTQAAMASAVDSAVSSGVVVVVAGGNDNSDACGFSPAFVPSAITVGSTTSSDTRSYFSNYGACTDIWAPGSDIRSAVHTSDTGSSVKSGTSMACPHVSGASALMLEADPTMSAEEVLRALLYLAYRNVITDLKAGDTNALLYVGADEPPAYTTLGPTPVPTPAPTPERIPCPGFARGPDGDGDCKCNSGKCSLDGGLTFMCPTSGSPGGWGGVYFLPTCTDCECVAPATTTTTTTTGVPGSSCPSFSRGPDGDGDCRCRSGKCSQDGGVTFMCPTSGAPGGWGGVYFLPSCTACECTR